MDKEENRINFDMSLLSLEQLIEVYNDIDKFIKTLSNKKIIQITIKIPVIIFFCLFNSSIYLHSCFILSSNQKSKIIL